MKNKVKYCLKRYNIVWILLFVIVVQLMVASLYMNSKQLMHIDEFYCYEGAHNVLLHGFGEPEYYLHTDDEWHNAWHTKEEFMELLEVRGDESILSHSLTKLNSDLKIKNIYYILLNITESFQSDPAMTKWSGFILNSIIFVLHQIVLYLIGWEIFRDKKKALLPMIIYGFSAGGITLIVYIRFYLLKSLMCLLIAYIHLKLLEWRNVWGIIAAYGVTAAAVLLIWYFQPHIVLYASSAVFVFMIACCIIKDYKLLLKYVGVGCTGVVAIMLFVPNVLGRIKSNASSDIGVQTISNFLHRSLKWYAIVFKFFFVKAISHVAGGVYTITAAGVMLAVIWYIQNRKEKVKWKKPDYFNLKSFYVISVSTCYFLVFCKIIHTLIYRYMSCIYPGFCVGIAILLEWILESCRVRRRGAVVCAVVLMGLFFGYMRNYVDEIYPEASEMWEEAARYPDADNLFVGIEADEHQYYRDGYLINDGTRMYKVNWEDIENVDFSFLDGLDGEGFLCWLPIGWDDELTQHRMEEILARTDYKEFERAFITYHSNVYYVY